MRRNVVIKLLSINRFRATELAQYYCVKEPEAAEGCCITPAVRGKDTPMSDVTADFTAAEIEAGRRLFAGEWNFTAAAGSLAALPRARGV